jgi:hypothetical protein
MKNNILKYYIVLALFLSTAMLFAQGPEQEDTNGTLEQIGQDGTGAAPIDDYLPVLALLGSAVVFFTLKSYTEHKNTLKN